MASSSIDLFSPQLSTLFNSKHFTGIHMRYMINYDDVPTCACVAYDQITVKQSYEKETVFEF